MESWRSDINKNPYKTNFKPNTKPFTLRVYGSGTSARSYARTLEWCSFIFGLCFTGFYNSSKNGVIGILGSMFYRVAKCLTTI